MNTALTPQELKIVKRAEQLGYTGDHALQTSGNPEEDELDFVFDEMKTHPDWSLDHAIHEVVRTRKHREQA